MGVGKERKKKERTRRGKDGREIKKRGKKVRKSQPVSTILPSFDVKYFYSDVAVVKK